MRHGQEVDRLHREAFRTVAAMIIRIQRGDGHPTWGAVWLDLGRLRLIWCAPPRPGSPGHPNRWMVVWRRGLPEWNAVAWNAGIRWQGATVPGLFWRSCDARLQRQRGVDP